MLEKNLCNLCLLNNKYNEYSYQTHKMILHKNGVKIVFDCLCNLHSKKIREYSRTKIPKEILILSKYIQKKLRYKKLEQKRKSYESNEKIETLSPILYALEKM